MIEAEEKAKKEEEEKRKQEAEQRRIEEAEQAAAEKRKAEEAEKRAADAKAKMEADARTHLQTLRSNHEVQSSFFFSCVSVSRGVSEKLKSVDTPDDTLFTNILFSLYRRR